MGSALFIVSERNVEGLETFVNGKALGHSEGLDQLAERAGVRPLMEFFSQDPQDLADLLDGEGIELPTVEPPPEHWFAAADGLLSVRGMLSYLSTDSERIPNGPAIVEDLKEFETLLSRLEAEGVRWHLAVDF